MHRRRHGDRNRHRTHLAATRNRAGGRSVFGPAAARDFSELPARACCSWPHRPFPAQIRGLAPRESGLTLIESAPVGEASVAPIPAQARSRGRRAPSLALLPNSGRGLTLFSLGDIGRVAVGPLLRRHGNGGAFTSPGVLFTRLIGLALRAATFEALVKMSGLVAMSLS